jgi:hypothetical protein
VCQFDFSDGQPSLDRRAWHSGFLRILGNFLEGTERFRDSGSVQRAPQASGDDQSFVSQVSLRTGRG